MPYASPSLRRLRQESGIKPGEFAMRLGVARGHLCHVEMQRRPASLELLARIAKALDVSITDLIDDERSKPAA